MCCHKTVVFCVVACCIMLLFTAFTTCVMLQQAETHFAVAWLYSPEQGLQNWS